MKIFKKAVFTLGVVLAVGAGYSIYATTGSSGSGAGTLCTQSCVANCTNIYKSVASSSWANDMISCVPNTCACSSSALVTSCVNQQKQSTANAATLYECVE